MAAAGIPVDPSILLDGDYTIEFGREAAKTLLQNKHKVEAIMTGSDLIAIGIVAQLQESSVRVPEDIEVIGYDNIELASVFQPPLSTISKPHYDMAQHIAKQLIRVIEGERVKLPHMTVEPELVLRNTTKKR